jgi:hypothetical protein
MKSSKFFFVLILCLSLFFFILEISANLSAAGMTSIRVLKKAEIEDDKMLLGKIAVIKGEDSSWFKNCGLLSSEVCLCPGSHAGSMSIT